MYSLVQLQPINRSTRKLLYSFFSRYSQVKHICERISLKEPDFEVELIKTLLLENESDVFKTMETLLPLSIVGKLLKRFRFGFITLYIHVETTPEEQVEQYEKEQREHELVMEAVRKGTFT
jgi:hypothetical protein